jgi:hypothetical protein
LSPGIAAPAEVLRRRGQQIGQPHAVEFLRDRPAEIDELDARIAAVGIQEQALHVPHAAGQHRHRSGRRVDSNNLAEVIGRVLCVLPAVFSRVTVVTGGKQDRSRVERQHAAARMAITANAQRDDGLRIRERGAVEGVSIENVPRVSARTRRWILRHSRRRCRRREHDVERRAGRIGSGVENRLAAEWREAHGCGGRRQNRLGRCAVPAIQGTGLVEQEQLGTGDDRRRGIATSTERADEIRTQRNV